MNSLELLNAAKKRLGLTSDYQAAKWLDITPQAMSNYQSGKRVIDDYAAARIAKALDVPPIHVIAVANMEREKVSEKRDFWAQIAQESGPPPICIFLIYMPFLMQGYLTIVRIMRNDNPGGGADVNIYIVALPRGF